MRSFCISLLHLSIGVAAAFAADAATADAVPDFEAEVAPILEAHCLSCHDAHRAKGDLRLDERIHALEAITPGNAADSSLIEQISGAKPEMPKKAAPLSAEAVRTLERWIAGGAPWPEGRVLKDNPRRNLDWWSLRPIVAVAPAGEGHPVDAFLRVKWQERGLQPVGEAPPATLVRRITFDLTGLPPTPDAVAEFVKASAVDPRAAWEKLVDQLLDSPAFGEKWGRFWLDLARYGETHGYDKDKPRLNAWPYRDYVIRAFNDDKPYDRFVQEQIAGDALFPGTADGVLGLGFLAAGPWDLIGHSEVGESKLDGRIAKHLDRDEMIAAVCNVFTSTTVQCAQCHHHKFDPVKMEDYYRLHAVFAAVDRADRVYAGLPPAQEKERNTLLARSSELKREQARLDQEVTRALSARTSAMDRRIAELKQKHGSPLRPQYGWHSQISQQQNSIKWVQLDLGAPKTADQIRIIPAFDLYAGIGAGFGFPVRYKVESADDPEFRMGVRMLRDATAADQPNPKKREITIDVGGAPVRYVRITATRLAPRKEDFIFALGEVEVIGGEAQGNLALHAAVTALDSIEQGPRWGRANLTDGIYHRELSDPAALAELGKLEDERAVIEAEIRTPEITQQLATVIAGLAEIQKQLAKIPKGEMVYAASTSFTAQGAFHATNGKARPIHLLDRGDLRNAREPMMPGMAPLWPGAAGEFPLSPDADESARRAALALAISSPENPLLWRSITNRLWQWTFGKPLVGTPNDFGRMGLAPTHPELLEYLAARLRDDPRHSLKGIIRLLMTSAAYRRASTHDDANALLDSNNTYLWRANRRRLTGEEIRDAVLVVAGKLQLAPRGGASFQDFVIEKPAHSPHYEYHLHDPDAPASHRRSIYRFVVRSQPQPFLTALDCADPSLSVAAREESTTALQALAQWNNRLVETMARHFATRIDGAKEDPITFACMLALGRTPSPEEHATLLAHHRAHGSASLARVIFNLNAFIYVD